MRLRFLLLVAVCFTGLLHAQEQPPVQVTTELGFSNLLLPGRPFPFRVEIASTGKAILGDLTVTAQSTGNGVTTYTIPVSLAPNARKRWSLTFPPTHSNTLHATLRDTSGKILSDQDYFGIMVDAASPLNVIVQGNTSSGRFVFPRKTAASEHGEWRNASVLPENLPEDPLAYAGVSAMLWRSDTPQALNEMQAAAIVEWVRHGGLLIVAGGRTVPPNLPATFSWPARWGDLAEYPLATFAEAQLNYPVRPPGLVHHLPSPRWRKETPPDSKIGVKPLGGDNAKTRLEAGGVKLLTEGIVDAGVVMQLAFDPSDCSAEKWPLGQEFWDQVLWLPPFPANGWETLDWLNAQCADPNHQALAQAADYRITSILHISTMFGVFFGLAFCLNFWLFRKSRRYEWAWLILVAASIGMFLYNRAYGRVGGFGPTRHVEISQSVGVAGVKSLVSFTEAGLLSPRTRMESLRTTTRNQILFGADQEHRSVRVDGNMQNIALEAKAGAFTTCSSIAGDSLPGEGITVKWETNATEVIGRITNKTGLPMSFARVPGNGLAGTTSGGDGGDYVVKIPIEGIKQWFAANLSAASLEGMNNYRRAQYYGAGSGRGVIYSGPSNPSDYGVVEFASNVSVLEFTISPGPALTAGSAPAGTCQRTYRLFAPFPVEVAKIPALATHVMPKPGEDQ